MTRRMRIAVGVWPWLLALIVLAPVLAPGYVLSYDMVFVPDLSMRSDFLGLGSSLPRAVPSDAVVAVVDEVVPGMLLQKLVLLAALVLAGVGATRLVPADAGVAQLAATSVYVWNPFVAERLGIGHWPLLLAYAALPWTIHTARRIRSGRGGWPALVVWLAVAGLSASGGVMAGLVAVAFIAGTGRSGLRRTALVLLAVLVVNLPWLVAGLLHGMGAISDPAGVEAFATRGEGPLPAWLTALGLGGVWNLEVVPLSRQGWAAIAWLVLLAGVCVVGARAWWTATPRRDVAAYVACGAVGLLLAVAGVLAPAGMAELVDTVPGAGMFRDGSRFLALLAPVEAALFGFGVAALSRVSAQRVANVALASGAVLMPLALMPDMAWGLGGALKPVQYPAEYAVAREQVLRATSEGPAGGTVLVLPFTSYRAPEWNHGRKVLDPLGRFLSPNFVASDDLYVSGRLISGEDPRARRLRTILSDPARDPSSRLAREGISWVALDLRAGRGVGRPVPTMSPPPQGLLHDGRVLKVWSLERGARDLDPPRGKVLVVASVWTIWGSLVLVCLALCLARAAALAGQAMRGPTRW